MNRSICPHCGRQMPVKYRHRFALHHVQALRLLAKAGGGPVNIKTLGLTRNQWDNFQKMQYWGVVVKAIDSTGRRGGVWKITRKGMAFLNGTIDLPEIALTVNGHAVGYEGNRYGIKAMSAPYTEREQWAGEAEAP